jgi:hypothetical protein
LYGIYEIIYRRIWELTTLLGP